MCPYSIYFGHLSTSEYLHIGTPLKASIYYNKTWSLGSKSVKVLRDAQEGIAGRSIGHLFQVGPFKGLGFGFRASRGLSFRVFRVPGFSV